MKAVFDPKLIVGGDQREVVLDESGFRAYSTYLDWGLKFLSFRDSETVLLSGASNMSCLFIARLGKMHRLGKRQEAKTRRFCD